VVDVRRQRAASVKHAAQPALSRCRCCSSFWREDIAAGQLVYYVARRRDRAIYADIAGRLGGRVWRHNASM